MFLVAAAKIAQLLSGPPSSKDKGIHAQGGGGGWGSRTVLYNYVSGQTTQHQYPYHISIDIIFIPKC